MPYFKGISEDFGYLHIIPIMTLSFSIHTVSSLKHNPVFEILSCHPAETSEQAAPV